MSKPAARSLSRHGREACELLGHLIHAARLERSMTVAEVAERAGVSRGLVHRIENGDAGCSIGAVFEIATIVGVQLFEAEPHTLTRHVAAVRDKLTLLPKAARARAGALNDDF